MSSVARVPRCCSKKSLPSSYGEGCLGLASSVRSGESGSAAETDQPEPRQRGRAVGALHGLEHLQRLRVLTGDVIGVAELQLGVVRAPEAAAHLDALLHHGQALLAFAVRHQVEAIVEQRL